MNSKTDFVDLYQNKAQALAHIIDPNKLYMVLGRGTGKTAYITTPRVMRVASLMPGESSAISHKSFVALFQNVIPTMLATFNNEITMPDGSKRPMLREGLDYVVGRKDLPSHFAKPRFPLLFPERTIVFANGSNLQAVAVDRPDSIAGRSLVHAFFEEMKYSDGAKVRSRIIPAIRTSRLGDGSGAHKCHLHGGITGVSDMGRVSMGEDNWFTDYEKDVDEQLISDIVSLALAVNKAQVSLQQGVNADGARRKIDRYLPLLSAMRKKAVFYLRASTFMNREVLGYDYFKTQLDSLSESEFLSSICSIGDRNRENLFFDLWDENKHTYSDGYIYTMLDKLVLTETFTFDASYLKHYEPTDKLLLGFDPGAFASCVAAQEKVKENTLRVMKEFFVFPPEDLADLARKINAYYGSVARNKNIDLYYDRAGNKKNMMRENETDAREFAAELRKLGWNVVLKNLGQRTIYYSEHYRLWRRLLAEDEKKTPRLRVDSNECPNLCSAMYCCKKVPGSTPIELDKSPEKKVRIDLQAGLTPQIPSALTYLVWGLYQKYYNGLGFAPTAPGIL
ncbi:MAG: hypothetical protein IJU69_00140 [Bacteroidales bacterium]|nr:hypothetical protein [Bacteroidales bacterium]